MPASTPGPSPPASRSAPAWRWVLLLLSVALAGALLAPVAFAPVHADDRYWYMMIAGRSGGSVIEILRWSAQVLPEEIASGRIASLASLQRRLIGLGVVEASVVTGVPVVAYQAFVKYVLLLAGVGASVGMVAALRWRTSDGRLVRATPRTLWIVAVALPLVIAAGAQAQGQFRNGWTSYAVLTYGVVVAIFGSVATVLWLTRLSAERPRRFTVLSTAALVTLAGLTSVSYEIVYPAVAVSAIALLVVPVAPREARRAGIRAKVIAASAYVGGFLVFFVAIRVYLSRLCAQAQCYEGVTPSLGPEAIVTSGRNLITALTLGSGNESLADMARVGWADRHPVGVTWWSVVAAALVLVVLVATWALGARDQEVPPHDVTRAEGLMLLVGALLAGLAAVGTSAVMALSVQAQEIVSAVGIPYRNTMVTWSSVALMTVLGALGWGLLMPARHRFVPWAATAVVVAVLVGTSLPTDLMVTRAHRALPSLQATEALHLELALGDTSPEADARRCIAFERVVETMGENWTVDQILRQANRAFSTFHGRLFCSEDQYPQ